MSSERRHHDGGFNCAVVPSERRHHDYGFNGAVIYHDDCVRWLFLFLQKAQCAHHSLGNLLLMAFLFFRIPLASCNCLSLHIFHHSNLLRFIDILLSFLEVLDPSDFFQ